MLDVKALMQVDICSSVQKRLFSIEELLPNLTKWVCNQIVRSKLRRKYEDRLTAATYHFVSG
jgi:hypothetical protein